MSGERVEVSLQGDPTPSEGRQFVPMTPESNDRDDGGQSSMIEAQRVKRRQELLRELSALELGEGDPPRVSFPGFPNPGITHGTDVTLGGLTSQEARSRPRLSEPKQVLELDGSTQEHDRWLCNARLFLQANDMLGDRDHIAYFVSKNVGSSLWPIFRAKLQEAGAFACWADVEIWVRSLQPRVNDDVLDRLEDLSQGGRRVIEYINEFDSILAETPPGMTLDPVLLYRAFRKGLDRSLITLLAGRPDVRTYTRVRAVAPELEQCAIHAGTFRPRLGKKEGSANTQVGPSHTNSVQPTEKHDPDYQEFLKWKAARKQSGRVKADQKQDAREQRLCFKCGKPGHIKRDCPELQANTVQRVPADAKGGFPLVIN